MYYYKITNEDGSFYLDSRNVPYYMPDESVQELTEEEYTAFLDSLPEPEEPEVTGYVITDEEINAAYKEGVNEA